MLGHNDVIVYPKSGAVRERVGPEVDAGGVGRGEERGGRRDLAAEPGCERLRVDVVAVEQLETVVTARETVVRVLVLVRLNVEKRHTQLDHLRPYAIVGGLRNNSSMQKHSGF